MLRSWLSRRELLSRGAVGAAVLGTAGVLSPTIIERVSASQEPAADDPHAQHQSEGEDHSLHGPAMTVGDVDTEAMGYDPSVYLTTFDYGIASQLPDGRTQREYNIVAVDKEIEIAPGVFFPAWTYNGTVPGPTIRCNEGDHIKINFSNAGSHPHTLHFHGIHSAYMDGVPNIGRGMIDPGQAFTYEFDAFPFGCHLYHCHAIPLKRHIHKGLYGAFIINPDPERHGELARSRHPDYPESEEWYEFVMVMNAFDTTFDDENEVYAVNTVAFHYMRHPIVVQRDRPIRIYLINVTEFDAINSFHLHANFFSYYDTGTTLEPTLPIVDTIMQVQGQRGIIEISFKDFEPGQYMFHAHVSEFAELGWMSVFEVVE
jgi:FtsP/CotA-like multicopper oxidase with cupredoxin domain